MKEIEIVDFDGGIDVLISEDESILYIIRITPEKAKEIIESLTDAIERHTRQ